MHIFQLIRCSLFILLFIIAEQSCGERACQGLKVIDFCPFRAMTGLQHINLTCSVSQQEHSRILSYSERIPALHFRVFTITTLQKQIRSSCRQSDYCAINDMASEVQIIARNDSLSSTEILRTFRTCSALYKNGVNNRLCVDALPKFYSVA
jgi:hypothetical protein